MQKGSCLCGAVAFEITGDLRPAIACHCRQCRTTSGHFWAATSATDVAMRFTRDDGLRWYQSSDTAKRGFCDQCGSSLFWKPEGQDRTAIAMGILEEPSGLHVESHVFVEGKGAYYEIEDGLPQHQQFSGAEDA
ncbi:GFA family protein [Roseovarius sp. EL26]|uniref:GFA family protein n=1 Tax=Roseovarius sp. EL26 TaxID=2126672 RepID=UPI000EA2206B|nr:GFA family protein [Roseovarius sp. EL26]